MTNDDYSLRKLCTGFDIAAFIACQLTVTKQMARLNTNVAANTQALSEVW